MTERPTRQEFHTLLSRYESAIRTARDAERELEAVRSELFTAVNHLLPLKFGP